MAKSLYSGGTSYQPPKKRRKGVSGSYQPSLGRQLSKRVSSGAITKEEAQRTAYEREVLAKAFGPEWRQKVYGQGGARGINGAFSEPQIKAKRTQALAKAKAKLKGGVGGQKNLGHTLRAPTRGIGPHKTRKRRLY